VSRPTGTGRTDANCSVPMNSPPTRARTMNSPINVIDALASAILFAITAARIFWGEQLPPNLVPFAVLCLPFLVMTLIGWIWSLLRESDLQTDCMNLPLQIQLR
jgi:hypothetical protein